MIDLSHHSTVFFHACPIRLHGRKNVYLFWKCTVYRGFEAKNKWIKTKKNTFTWLATSVHLTPNICGFASKMLISLINSNDAPVMLYQAMGSSQTKLFLVKLRDICTHKYFDASHDRIKRTSCIIFKIRIWFGWRQNFKNAMKLPHQWKLWCLLYKITSKMLIRCLNQVYKWNIYALKMSSLHPLDYHLLDILIYFIYVMNQINGALFIRCLNVQLPNWIKSFSLSDQLFVEF